jgi:hypothetical protein
MCSSPPSPPKPPQEEQKIDEAGSQARDRERQRQRASAYASIDQYSLTGGTGLTAPASTAQKTLLGA